MKCSNCGKELKSSWKICPYCGQKAEEKNLCPECGEEVEADWEACPFCGTKLKKPKKDIGFNFDELDELNDAFDKQLQEEENLNRANVLCIRGEYERALKLYEDYIDKHYDRIEGYIGLVRVYSKDYTIYEGEQIENSIRTVERLSKKAQIADEEYNNYISSKKKYSSDKKVKEAEAEAKKRAAEAAEKKRAEEEAAKKRAEEEAAKKLAEKEAQKKRPDDKFVILGMWPRSKKSSSVTISDSKDANGYFTGSDGNKYARVRNVCFKVEPIKWRIIDKNGAGVLLLCENIISPGRYDSYKNNYANSEIRKWLNGEFLNKAFSPSEQKMILYTSVNNGAESTIWLSNPYSCENTQDKIFLLSREEVYKKYNFGEDIRLKYPTEYAKAKGALTWEEGNGEGWWWTRSPYAGYNRAVHGVGCNGVDYYSDVFYNSRGIVPAMWIKL